MLLNDLLFQVMEQNWDLYQTLKNGKAQIMLMHFVIDFITGKIERVTGFEKTTQTTETGTVNVTVNDPKGYAISPSAIRISYRGCSNFVTGNSATFNRSGK